MTIAFAFLVSVGMVCATVAAVRWIDRCDCRFANDTDAPDRWDVRDV